jgi:tetratricopeptide (TPR) repeat protein
MRSRLFGFAVFSLTVVAWAQGNGADTGAPKPSGASASQTSSSEQSSDAKPTAPNPAKTPKAQPPASELSRDLTFPGDKPADSDKAKKAQEDKPGNTPAESQPTARKTPDLTPPRSDRVRADELEKDIGESSSKDSQVDLNPPEDDTKAHPKSSAAVAEAEAGISPSGISEFKTWDPHRAAKDIEVGDFYFKRQNYRAAEERYREALQFKKDDAVATIRLAISLDKLGVLDDARAEYESYLKILPHGPEAGQAQKALDRMKAAGAAAQ